MKKLLVVVDMQNDFIDGALGTPEAQSIVQPVADFIREFDGDIFYTQDTHAENYLETQEGKRLPVEHCIKDSVGWQLAPKVWEPIFKRQDRVFKKEMTLGFQKDSFGSRDLYAQLRSNATYFGDCEIHFVGVCTGICVISNAVLAKTALPEARIVIHSDLCACVSKESHWTAIEAMKLLQMEVV